MISKINANLETNINAWTHLPSWVSWYSPGKILITVHNTSYSLQVFVQLNIVKKTCNPTHWSYLVQPLTSFCSLHASWFLCYFHTLFTLRSITISHTLLCLQILTILSVRWCPCFYSIKMRRAARRDLPQALASSSHLSAFALVDTFFLLAPPSPFA